MSGTKFWKFFLRGSEKMIQISWVKTRDGGYFRLGRPAIVKHELLPRAKYFFSDVSRRVLSIGTTSNLAFWTMAHYSNKPFKIELYTRVNWVFVLLFRRLELLQRHLGFQTQIFALRSFNCWNFVQFRIGWFRKTKFHAILLELWGKNASSWL